MVDSKMVYVTEGGGGGADSESEMRGRNEG